MTWGDPQFGGLSRHVAAELLEVEEQPGCIVGVYMNHIDFRLYKHIYIHMYVHVYIHLCVYIYVYTYIQLHSCTHTHIYMNA